MQQSRRQASWKCSSTNTRREATGRLQYKVETGQLLRKYKHLQITIRCPRKKQQGVDFATILNWASSVSRIIEASLVESICSFLQQHLCLCFSNRNSGETFSLSFFVGGCGILPIKSTLNHLPNFFFLDHLYLNSTKS